MNALDERDLKFSSSSFHSLGPLYLILNLCRVTNGLIFCDVKSLEEKTAAINANSKHTALLTKVVPQKRESVRDNADWYYGLKEFGVD